MTRMASGKAQAAWLIFLTLAASAGGIFLLTAGTGSSAQPPQPSTGSVQRTPYFAIEVVDEQTGRGVPLAELQATSGARYYTDSNGLIAFYEPGLMDRKVYFGVAAHGYEFAPDGFGIRGAVLEVKPGGGARLKVKRLNIAERLYRLTGQGIYRDTILLGRKAPISQPLLNAEVTGQDSIMNAVYGGKLYWFYGDTGRVGYALGNFAMSGATTPLPERLKPSTGIDLSYFVGPDGFSRPMAPRPGEGVVWLGGISVVPDENGRDRMLAFFQRRRGLGAVLESGFMEYDDAEERFEKIKDADKDASNTPTGHPFLVKGSESTPYLYFTNPYPALRVRADRRSYTDLAAYEGYTCLKPGTRYTDKDSAPLERDSAGKLVWGWKKGTAPLTAEQQQALITAGKIRAEETPFRLRDADNGKPVQVNSASCNWNAYRKKYILIASEVHGASVLGEVWYSEADRPEGPWTGARKIITHANKPGDAHDFYNPKQHPYFDQEGGRVIYLEGTYVNTFSGNPHPTPYYEYNQILYRVDLADPRLKLSQP